MSDVASILGIKAPAATAEETMKSIIDGPKKQTTKPKVVKPAGMAREVFQLVGQNSIAPSVQPSKVTPAYKTKRTNAAKGKWIWTSFHNSARSDNKEFYHWQRADIQFNDYPFAKFNIKMDSIRYTDDEYNSFLTNTKWSRSETDYLMYICHRYDLRWPVIADRYDFVPTRPLAEIQERYFEVSSKLNTKRTANANGSNTNSQSSHVSVKDSNGIRDKEIVFDVNYEKDRKHQQDHLFKHNTIDDAELKQVALDIQLVEEKLLKLRQMEADAIASTATVNTQPFEEGVLIKPDPDAVSVELQGSNDAVPVPVPVPLAVDATDSRPVSDPVPTGEPAVSVSPGVDASSGALNEANTPLAALESKEMGGPDNDVELEEMDDSDTEPCLQSTRLANSEYSSQLTNVLLKKMEIALIELGISPDQLLPTMAVCDLYDILRKDLVSLLTLKTELNRKGSELNELIRSTDILHHSASNSNGITTPRGSDTSQCSAPSATSCISLNQTLFANRKFVLPLMDSANKDGSTKIGNNASGPGRSNKPNYKKNDTSETTKKSKGTKDRGDGGNKRKMADEANAIETGDGIKASKKMKKR